MPSIAPGTGLPSLGGMYYRELVEALRGIAKRGNVIGFDVCEVAPQYDPAGVTAFTAAGIIVEFLGLIFNERNKRRQGILAESHPQIEGIPDSPA